MIDPDLVTRKLALITGDLTELRAVAAKSFDEYVASPRDELVRKVAYEER